VFANEAPVAERLVVDAFVIVALPINADVSVAPVALRLVVEALRAVNALMYPFVAVNPVADS
jgi:hypothetical protein